MHFCFLCFSIAVVAQADLSYAAAIDSAKAQEKTTAAIAMLDALIQKAQSEKVLDTLALLYHTRGVKLYGLDIYKAIASTQQAIELRKELKDTAGLAQSYFNTARFYKQFANEPRQALPYFEAIAGLGDSPKNGNYLISFIYLGQIERDFGDYARAVQHLELGLNHFDKIDNFSRRDSLLQTQFQYTLGSVYRLMGTRENLEQSLQYLLPAAATLKQLEVDYDLANCYTEISNSYTLLEDYDQGIQYLKKALALYRKNEDEDEVARTLNNIGFAYIDDQQYPKAIAALQQGLAIRNKINGAGFHASKAPLADNLADAYLKQGLYQKAISFYQQAIQHILPGFCPNAYEENPSKRQLQNASDKESLLTYLGDKAKAWDAFYAASQNPQHLQQGLSTLQLADYLIDLMRLEHTAEESKLIWRRKVHRIYEQALDISYLLSDLEQAFYFLEKSKSILLLDGLMAADARQVIPDSIAQRERQLNKVIIDLKAALEAEPNNPKLRTQLLDQQKASVDLVNYLAATYPNYHELRYTPNVIDLQTAKQLNTDQSQLLVQYFFGDRHIYIMPIELQEARLVRIKRDSSLDQQLLSLIAKFQDAAAIINAPQQYAQEAYKLYQKLLAPVFEGKSKTSISELCIVLDGLLQYLPFEALLYESTEGSNLGQLPYLVKNYVVRYTYSATILKKQTEMTRTPGIAKILGFAPFANGEGEMGRLQFSAAELGGVARLARGQYYYDQEASTLTFLKEAPHFQVLHLSTHAAANTNQGKPFIFFNDQKLYLPHLYALELPAELVILSACETGLGKVQTGEGVMSLARGFTYAGARSLISSLWSVNDRSTADLFTDFYQNLQSGIYRSKALHQAKLNYLNNRQLPEDQKSPYYWAGFVYIGGDGPLTLEKPTGWWKWGLGLLMGLVLGGLWWKMAGQRKVS